MKYNSEGYKWTPREIDRSEPEYRIINSDTAENKCNCGDDAVACLDGEWLCEVHLVSHVFEKYAIVDKGKQEIRPEIMSFAEAMEAEIRKNQKIDVNKLIGMLKMVMSDTIRCGDAEVEDDKREDWGAEKIVSAGYMGRN